MTPTTRILHVTDHHVPYHDKRVVDLSLEAARILRPTHLVLGGDLVDLYRLSRYRQRSDKLHSFQRELAVGQSLLDAYAEACPDTCHRVLLQGNHEQRLEKYIDAHAPALGTLSDLNVSNLLKATAAEYDVVGVGGQHRIGPITFIHGARVRKYAGMSAVAMMDSVNQKALAMGHSHRLGSVFIRRGRHLYRAYESGCACKLRLAYNEYQPDWQQGFSVFFVEGQDHQWLPIDASLKDPLFLLRKMTSKR